MNEALLSAEKALRITEDALKPLESASGGTIRGSIADTMRHMRDDCLVELSMLYENIGNNTLSLLKVWS